MHQPRRLLLHGRGVPLISVRIEGRPVVVVVASHGWEDEMRGVKAEGGWAVVCTEEVEFHHTSEVAPYGRWPTRHSYRTIPRL